MAATDKRPDFSFSIDPVTGELVMTKARFAVLELRIVATRITPSPGMLLTVEKRPTGAAATGWSIQGDFDEPPPVMRSG